MDFVQEEFERIISSGLYKDFLFIGIYRNNGARKNKFNVVWGDSDDGIEDFLEINHRYCTDYNEACAYAVKAISKYAHVHSSKQILLIDELDENEWY